MTTLIKKIEIPADRKLILQLDLPSDIVPGQAEIQVTFNQTKKKRSGFSIAEFYGVLKDYDIFIGDGVEVQRAMRDEW
jgi:hypothetical protein